MYNETKFETKQLFHQMTSEESILIMKSKERVNAKQ